MPVNDELGKRMKTYYEQVPKYRLMRRTPVIIRIDGKAFHSFTKGFQRPFDEVFGRAMTRPGIPVASQGEALSTGKARGTPGSCHQSKSPPED